MEDKSNNKTESDTSQLAEGATQFCDGFMQTVTAPKFIHRSYAGYFAPVIAAWRLIRKHNWHYLHQLRVVYRYAFWRGGRKN
jgi:hypothetical protein